MRFLAPAIFPTPEILAMIGQPSVAQLQLQLQQVLARLSPITLFGEAVLGILRPETRALGPVIDQLQGTVIGSLLPFGQSLLLVWPQLAGLIAGALGLFVATFVAFQRQEVRA